MVDGSPKLRLRHVDQWRLGGNRDGLPDGRQAQLKIQHGALSDQELHLVLSDATESRRISNRARPINSAQDKAFKAPLRSSRSKNQTALKCPYGKPLRRVVWTLRRLAKSQGTPRPRSHLSLKGEEA